jgi:hypothetical protein
MDLALRAEDSRSEGTSTAEAALVYAIDRLTSLIKQTPLVAGKRGHMRGREPIPMAHYITSAADPIKKKLPLLNHYRAAKPWVNGRSLRTPAVQSVKPLIDH